MVRKDIDCLLFKVLNENCSSSLEGLMIENGLFRFLTETILILSPMSIPGSSSPTFSTLTNQWEPGSLMVAYHPR